MSQRSEVFCECASHCLPRGGQWIKKSSASLHRQDDVRSGRSKRRVRSPARTPSASNSRPTAGPHTPSTTPQHSSSSITSSSDASHKHTTGTSSVYSFGPPAFDASLAAAFRLEVVELLDEVQPQTLRFACDPSAFILHTSSSFDPYPLVDDERYRLAPASPRNAQHFYMQSRFNDILDMVELWPPSTECRELGNLIHAAFNELDMRRVRAWTAQRFPNEDSNMVHTEDLCRQDLPRDMTVASAYLGIIALSTLGQLDREGGRMLLSIYRDSAASKPETAHAVPHIPKDPRQILRSINLSPSCQRYACCPGCSWLYPSDTGIAPPINCTHKSTPDGKTCGETLMKQSSSSSRLVPILTYKHQDFILWLARLLLRPEIEDFLEQAHRQPMDGANMSSSSHGTRFTTMPGEDGAPFLPGPTSETRLVFGWSHDGFNPYGNQAPTASSTGFWLVCMSLPESIRYREENVFFAGCFPGKFDGHEIDSVLTLIVNVFLRLWKGVWFSRTHKHRHGRLVKAAVVPQISDSVALREGAGHGPHSASQFCLYCALLRGNIENMEKDTWPAYDMDKLFNDVIYPWKNARTDTERANIWAKHSQRWTPFFELPYFRYLLDNLHDPLHLFKLGLIPDLMDDCLAHKAPGQKAGSFTEKTWDRPSADELEPLYKALIAARSDAELETFANNLAARVKGYSWAMCKDLELRSASTKTQLASNVAHWRRFTSEDSVRDAVDKALIGLGKPALNPEAAPEPLPEVTTPAPSRSSSRASSKAGLTKAEKAAVEEEYIQSLQELGSTPAVRDLMKRFFLQHTVNTITTNSNAQMIDAICYNIGIPWKGIKVPKKIELIFEQVHLEFKLPPKDPGTRAQPLHTPRTTTSQEAGRISLTTAVMNEIYADQGLTQLPSFGTHAPPDWGTAGRGKLSGAQNTVLLCVHLVVTLIRLWGDLDVSDRRRQHLDHVMKLVDIVLLVFRKSLSNADIDAYDEMIKDYMINKKRLFKDVTIKPNDHAAMHYGDVLRGYGPSCGHDGSYFERCIRRLHSFKINLKPGQQESTFMDSAGRFCNLRALLLDEDERLRRFSHFLQEHRLHERWDSRGTQLGGLLFASRKLSTLEGALYLREHVSSQSLEAPRHRLLLDYLAAARAVPSSLPANRDTILLPEVAIGGVAYRTESSRARDSVIAYKRPDGTRAAGVITTLLLHSARFAGSSDGDRPRLLLIVRPYQPLQGDETELDAKYRRYPNGGFCCKREVASEVLLSPTLILSHVATTPICMTHGGVGKELLHCLPMGGVASALASGLGDAVEL